MPTAVRRTIGLLLLLCACAPAYAQFETSSIVGTVRDTTVAVVPAATVTLTRTATGVALTPAASFVVSGIQQDFRGANNYRPNITCDPASASPTITAYFNASCVVIPTGPSKPC